MTDIQNQQRAFTRVTTAHPATVTGPDGVERTGTLRDVALNGVFITGIQIPIDSPIRLRITLNPDAAITGEGRIARLSADGVGIVLDVVEGTESYEYLRNLVLYNTRTFDETTKIVGEISRVSGLRAIDPLAPPPM